MRWPWQRGQKAQARDKPSAARARDLRMINRPRADMTIGGNEAIYAAVSRISNTLASMPMHFYKGYEIQKEALGVRLLRSRPDRRGSREGGRD